MTFLLAGAAVGLVAALVLTIALHRLPKEKGLLVLLATLFLSLAPRVYLGMTGIVGADFLYTFAWMLVSGSCFALGCSKYGKRLFGRSK